jgi:predicted TPR repeat methyltransferase
VRKIAVPDALVADFGCGTGLVGEAMTKLGFRNIYGIDCSEGMLQIA